MFHPPAPRTAYKSTSRLATNKRSLLLSLLIVAALVGVVLSGSSVSVYSSGAMMDNAAQQSSSSSSDNSSALTSPAADPSLAQTVAAGANISSPSSPTIFKILFPTSTNGRLTATTKRSAHVDLNRVLSSPALFPAVLAATGVTATKTAVITTDTDGDGKADPSTDTITYTVVITNNEATFDATNVIFTDTIDTHTLLVGGSVNSSALAVNDTYAAAGNIKISPPLANGLLANDFDPDTGLNTGFTALAESKKSANYPPAPPANMPANNVTINADGTFTYDPPPGFTGTDTFTYTAQAPDATTSVGTVTITVTGMIWFINNAGPGLPGGDGRITNPFKALSNFQAVNDGIDNNGTKIFHPAADDNIFIYESGTSYVGPVTLLAGQKLIGQDSSATLSSLTGVTPPTGPPNGSDPLPATNSANGVLATITNGAGNGVNLGPDSAANPDNLLRGFTISGTSGIGLFGSNFGTLSLTEVNVSSNGQALSLTTGTLSGPTASTATFGTVSSGGGTNGVLLSGIAGTMTATGGSLTGASGATFSVVGGTLGLTYNGAITQANAAAAVSVSGGHQTGTLLFQTGTISSSSTSTGLQFDNADGVYDFSGTTTLTGAAGVNIVNGSGGNFTFSTLASITNPSGIGFNVNGGNGSITYSGSISKNNAGRAIDIESRNGGSVSIAGAISSTGTSTGILVKSNTGGTVNFTNATTKTLNTAANTAVTLDTNSGATINFTNGNLNIDTTSAPAFVAFGGGIVNISGSSNTVDSTASKAIDITGVQLTATFASISSVGSSTQGINLGTLTGPSSFTVSGTTTVTSATGTSINVGTAGAGSALTFNGISITQRGGTGILLSSVQGTATFNGTTTISNTVNTGSGYGMRIDNSAANVTINSIAISNPNLSVAETGTGLPTNEGDGDGIFLTNNTGTFALNGGTISNADADGIDLRRPRANVTITNVIIDKVAVGSATNFGHGMHITDANSDGASVTVTLNNCTFTRFDGDKAVDENHDGVQVIKNDSDALTLNSNGCSYTDSAHGNDGLFVESRHASGNVTLNVQDGPSADHNIFQDLFGDGVNVVTTTGAGGTVNANVLNSTFGPAAVNGNNGIGLIPFGGPVNLNYNITGNTLTDVIDTGSSTLAAINIFPGSPTAPPNAPNVSGTVSNNIIDHPTKGVGRGITFEPDNVTGNCHITNNTIDRITGGAGGFGEFGIFVNALRASNVDVTIDNNDLGTKPGSLGIVGGSNHEAILLTTQNSSIMRSLITGNVVKSNAGLETVRARATNTSNHSATFTSNDIEDLTTASHFELAGASNGAGSTSTLCVNMNTNTLRSGGVAGAGIISLSEAAGCTINVTQASAAALAAANGIPAGNVTVSGSPTFGAATCGLPTAMLNFGPRRDDFAKRTDDTPQFDGLPAGSTAPVGFIARADNLYRTVATQFGIITGERPEAVSDTVFMTEAIRASLSASDLSNINASAEPLALRASLEAVAEPLSVTQVAPPAVTAIEQPRTSDRLSESIASNDTTVRSASAQSSARPNAARDGSRAQLSHASIRRPRAAVAAAMLAPDVTVAGSGGGFTLPAGKSVTITFQVTVKSPPQFTPPVFPAIPQISNQGHVTGTLNAAVFNVDTDKDVPAAGATDPTLTNGGRFHTTTAVVSDSASPVEGQSVTFTATVSSTEISPAKGGFMDFFDGVTLIAGCTDVPVGAVVANQATCTTTALTAAGSPHTIKAQYKGDGNYEPSFGTVSQTVSPCTANPVVQNTNPTGAGSLREAIQIACVGSVITFNTAGAFSTPQTITLTSGGELLITKNLTINGPSAAANRVTISGNDTGRVFNIQAGKIVSIKNLTITDGAATGASFPDTHGGAIFNAGTLNLINSTVRDSVGKGGAGGIYTASGSTLNVVNSTINGNSTQDAATGGGGLAVDSATATITNSTISNNSTGTGGQGGGLHNSSGTVTITNSTIVNNTTTGGAGSGGGVKSEGAATVNLRNTIVANNTASTGADLSGTFDSTDGFNLIEDITGATLTGTNQNNITGQDPNLGPLASNGGLNQTHALLFGSPAIEAGRDANLPADTLDLDGDANVAETLPVDGRGLGFARRADSADAGTTQTVDIGAFEVQPTINDIPDKTDGLEDASIAAYPFNVGDAALGIDSITAVATSDPSGVIQSIVVNNPTTATPDLSINYVANKFGVVTITVTVNKTINGQLLTMSDSFVLTVSAVADVPTLTPSSDTTNEDTQTASPMIITPNGNDGAEVTHFKISNITNGTVFKSDGVTPVPNNSFITLAEGAAGLKFTPAANLFSPASIFGFQVQGATDGAGAGLGTAATATFTVNPVADTPSATGSTTNEDTQTTTGLVIIRNAADSTEVTHFKITGITGGTLFKHDGVTQINNGDFILVADAADVGGFGLKFTPTADLFSPTNTFGFTVQASTSGVDGGLGGSTVPVSITVNPVADTPNVTNSTTTEDTQTSTGLVITRNAVDSTEVTHFKITSITNGTLFKHDGVTQINNGDFITVAEGADVGGFGLKFTPALNSIANGSFQVQGATSAVGAGLSPGFATATITVNGIADTPSVTNTTTNEDTQSSTGLVITKNAADGAEVTHFKITNITGGTLYKHDGVTVINNGDFITVAEGADVGGFGLKFTPTADVVVPGSFRVQAALDGVGTGLSSAFATATIFITPIGDTPTVTGSTTAINTQTNSGLVITRNVVDGAEVTHFKITNITNGTLYKHDGTTVINNGDFITVAEGANVGGFGLKFTPDLNESTPGGFTFSFDVQAGTDNVGGGLSTGSATATIIVDCQSGLIVTNTLDNGSVGSLRQVVNFSCPDSTITFDSAAFAVGGSPYTITLGSELGINKNLTITGPTASRVILSGGASGRVFNITSGNVNISNLTISGSQAGAGNGGGLLNSSTGTVTITNSTFTGNTATNGGAIATIAGTVNIYNTTISGNTVTGDGGGLYHNTAGTVNVLNTTIYNNHADTGQGGGIASPGGTTNVKSSIVAGNTASTNANVSGTITDLLNNILSGDPKVAALASNGGPTQTHALLAGSLALDAGDNCVFDGTCAAPYNGITLTTDQRGTGFSRKLDAADADTTQTVDIGAFEADPTVEDITDKTTAEDTALPTFTFNVGDSATAFDSITAVSGNTTLVPNANITIGAPTASTRTLAITPASNENSPASGTATITVTVTKTISGTVVSMSDTFVLTVTEVNDAPTATADALSSVAEDSGVRTIPFTDLTGNDVKGPANESGQTLTITNVGSPVGGTVQIVGTDVQFTPTANFNGAASFQYTVTDNGTTNGAADPKNSIATVTFNITGLNDAPTLDALGNLTINEDAPLQTVNLTGITTGGGESQTLVITATSNNTSLIPNPTVNYTSPNATGSLTFTPVADQSGSALITVTVNDGGGTAGGGVDTVVRTFTVTVNAINDAPVNTVPGAQSTDESTPITFSAANSNRISISDVDAGAAAVQVTLTATNGTLTLSSTAGLAFLTGDGTADATMTFTGTVASINSALSSVVFTPTPAFFGAASVQITTSDLGNAGAGGALSDTDTIPITVIERNLKFDSANYSVGEADGHAVITVVRAGGTTLPATVDYETSDLSGLNNCNVNTGNASQRCDYTTMRGTLSFAPGQSSSNFVIPIINDVYVEGPETLTITLSNPTGGILGTPSTATLTINDDDTTPGAPNPIDLAAFFIRQHYLDFLNREPEPSGLAGWLAIIQNCPAGDTTCDFIEVSSGFFRSDEYFERAYFVYRFYETALGRKPTYAEYQHDITRLTGFLTNAELEQRKVEFANEFVQRPEFKALYDSKADGDDYVNAIVAAAGVVPSNRTSVAIRQGALIITRAQALRELVESQEIIARFYNKAFVVVGYFAYLRRDPDALYLVWVDKLNNPPAGMSYRDIYRGMIRGFIQSQEYRSRFGLP